MIIITATGCAGPSADDAGAKDQAGEMTFDAVVDLAVFDGAVDGNTIDAPAAEQGVDGPEPDSGHSSAPWAFSAGGSESDVGYRIAMDKSGSIYVTGGFSGTATFGTTKLTATGIEDMFVVKLDGKGKLIWAKSFGGTGGIRGDGIAVDSAGNSYVAGGFTATVKLGSFSLVSAGSGDVFVAKLDGNGAIKWAVSGGGTNGDVAARVVLDSAGNSYITGTFGCCPATGGTAVFGSTKLTSNGSQDLFVAKLDSSGKFVWAAGAGGPKTDTGKGLAVDGAGNSYVTGTCKGTATFGANTATAKGSVEMYVAKLDSSGSFGWVTVVSTPTDGSKGYGIAVDSAGNSYVAGSFGGIATFGSTTLPGGISDLVVAKLDSKGSFVWAVKAGELINQESARDIALDSVGNSYITGYFGYGVPNATATFGTTTLTSKGKRDVYAAKLDNAGNFIWAYGAGGADSDIGHGIVVDGKGAAYVTGHFGNSSGGSATFGSSTLVSKGKDDVFIWRPN